MHAWVSFANSVLVVCVEQVVADAERGEGEAKVVEHLEVALAEILVVVVEESRVSQHQPVKEIMAVVSASRPDVLPHHHGGLIVGPDVIEVQGFYEEDLQCLLHTTSGYFDALCRGLQKLWMVFCKITVHAHSTTTSTSEHR